MRRNLWPAVLVILGTVSAVLYFLAYRVGDLRAHTLTFIYIFFTLFVVYSIATVIVLKLKTDNRQILIFIIVTATLFRLITIFSSPTLSDDIYRYSWDGKVQNAGLSPYEFKDDADELSFLRDSIEYKNLGNRGTYSIYQPAAQMFFLLASKFGTNSVPVIKLLLSIFDIGSIIVLIMILKELDINRARVLIYAWSPLVVFEISHSGHIDGLVVFLMLLALLARFRNRNVITGVLLGLAVAIKLFPLLFVPALAKRRDLKLPASLAGTLGIIYALYMIGDGFKPFRVFTMIASEARFNAGLKYFIELYAGQSKMFDNIYMLSISAVIITTGVVLFVRSSGSKNETIRNLLILTGLLIILLPFLTPWNLLVIMPLLAVYPLPAFIYLSGSVGVSYLFFAPEFASYYDWIRPIQYVPFFLLLGGELFFWYLRSRKLNTPTRVRKKH